MTQETSSAVGPRTRTFVALLLAAFLSPFASAQELDADIKLGDQFKGEIIHNSDIDVLRFSALQSSLITVTIKSSSKMKPVATIRNADTGAVIDTQQFEKGLGSKEFQLKKVPLPETGSYEVRIRTQNFKFGTYTVKTSVKYPNTLTKVKTFLNMTAGETKTIPIFADAGSKITGIVKGGNGELSLPEITTLATPVGPTDISGFVVTKGKKLKLKKIFVDHLGEYGLEITNVGAAGLVFADLVIAPEKVKKVTWKEPKEPTDPGTISGQITAVDMLALNETEPNDSIADAEFVGLSFPGKTIRTTGSTSDNGFPGGQDGQPTVSADLDSFRIAVEEGQTLNFTLVHSIDNDFDIGLWDVSAGQWIGFVDTAAVPEVGSLTATPQPGQTLLLDVIVYSYSGTGSYILTMNAGAPAKGAASDDGDDTEENLPPFLLNAPTGKNALGALAGSERYLELNREFVPGEFIIRLKDDNADARAFATERGLFVKLASPTGPTLVRDPKIQALPKASQRRATVIAKERLRNHPAVKYTQLNYILKPLAIPNDPNYNQQWHYPLINLPQAWDITKGSSDIIVAVIDSGITAHPDLVGRDTGFGIDMISDPAVALDGDGIDQDPTDPGDQGGHNGLSSWHGTHVAGTVGAGTNNGIGVSGVDWNCKLMHIRVLGKGGGNSFDTNEGIKYAAGVANASMLLPQKRANVINLSLGGNGAPPPMEQEAINLARANGTVIVAAAGNDNIGTPQSPASAQGVIAVSAVGQTKAKSSYSNWGPYVDIAAPGGDNDDPGILSTFVNEAPPGFNYKVQQGTSMACPHIAGICALILSVNPNLTPDQVEQFITTTAEDLGDPGKDVFYGHGLVNVFEAVKAAGAAVNPTLSLSTATLDYGKASTALNLTISNTGGGNLAWTAVDTEATGGNWMSLSASNGGPGQISVTVDRGTLAAGVYTGSIAFTSNGGNGNVNVSMEVGAAAGPPLLAVSTESMNFSSDQTSLLVQLQNNGGQALNWNAASAETNGTGWLSIAGTPNGSLNPAQSHSLTVNVNRAGQPEGAYTGSVTINSDGGQKVIAIAMNVAAGTNPKLSVSATTAHFGATKTTVPVMLNNAGGGTLTYTAADTEAGGGTWLNVTPTNGTAPKTLDITIDRTGLAAGNYTGVVNVTSNGGNTVINVFMEVLPKDLSPINLGNIYVIAVDPVTYQTGGQDVVTQFNGAYSMFGVPVGVYMMVAGPDLDGDGFICGTGEPCGLYPVTPAPTLLTISSGQILSGIHFSIAEDQVIPAGSNAGWFQMPLSGFPVTSKPDLQE